MERDGVTQTDMHSNSHICIVFDMRFTPPLLLLLHKCVMYYISKAYCFPFYHALCEVFVAFACVLYFRCIIMKASIVFYVDISQLFWMFVWFPFFEKKNDNRLTWILVLVTNYSHQTKRLSMKKKTKCNRNLWLLFEKNKPPSTER